jgi:hypothetical protein
MKLSFGKKIASLAVVGAVLAGAGTVAWADSNTGASTASTSTAAPVAATAAPATASHRGLDILRRADHGVVEIKVKGAATGTTGTAGAGTTTWQTVTFDRGKVSNVTAGQITLARPDGTSVTLTINASTTYKGVTSWQQVTTAKGAIVVSENETATTVAQRVAPASGSAGIGGTSSTTSPLAA